MKFNMGGHNQNLLMMLFKNQTANASLTGTIPVLPGFTNPNMIQPQTGLVGLERPGDALRKQVEQQKKENPEKETSRSGTSASESESSDTSESEQEKSRSKSKEAPDSPAFLPSPIPRKADDTKLDEELKKLQEEKRKVEEAE